jgi:hypothetical protein
MMRSGIKLRATDAEDFQVLSAILQDALIPVREVAYISADRRFVLVGSRFKWENCSEAADAPVHPVATPPADDLVADAAFADCQAYERVNCGICFENVTQVRRRGFDPRDRNRILELLTVSIEASAITLVFAGGCALRLEGPDIKCRIEDLGEPWPTPWRPRHAIGETA